ncbi:hypothetical protein [Amycolatopsis sp. TNS106]
MSAGSPRARSPNCSECPIWSTWTRAPCFPGCRSSTLRS